MVITFRTYFQKNHPQYGFKTYFVEQMIEWYWDTQSPKYHNVTEMLLELNQEKHSVNFIENFCLLDLDPDQERWKSHTIRAGHRFKVGDKFKPVIWYGLPYRSKQFQFLPELTVEKTWDFRISSGCFGINGRMYSGLTESDHEFLEEVAGNDGLEKSDFVAWFNFSKRFDGQIICWNEKIEYKV